MKKLVCLSLSILICLCMLGATERQAFAYVDPGSGLLALQSLASVAAAFGYFMRRRIRLLFSRSAAAKPVLPVAKDGSANPA
jgi:hypothetical protein